MSSEAAWITVPSENYSEPLRLWQLEVLQIDLQQFSSPTKITEPPAKQTSTHFKE